MQEGLETAGAPQGSEETSEGLEAAPVTSEAVTAVEESSAILTATRDQEALVDNALAEISALPEEERARAIEDAIAELGLGVDRAYLDDFRRRAEIIGNVEQDAADAENNPEDTPSNPLATEDSEGNGPPDRMRDILSEITDGRLGNALYDLFESLHLTAFVEGLKDVIRGIFRGDTGEESPTESQELVNVAANVLMKEIPAETSFAQVLEGHDANDRLTYRKVNGALLVDIGENREMYVSGLSDEQMNNYQNSGEFTAGSRIILGENSATLSFAIIQNGQVDANNRGLNAEFFEDAETQNSQISFYRARQAEAAADSSTDSSAGSVATPNS